ncbi:hypothetical protein KC19_VG234400 [Ceratodon purpureus]|uniref:Uncharacterized protein n=1 Tax=Ceratodon purpureus TaxID=3225 RepID=A0A8T0HUA3_CERPU|nr:hypothetical protein KC19_VG234400 [Ceratodon purpureus]
MQRGSSSSSTRTCWVDVGFRFATHTTAVFAGTGGEVAEAGFHVAGSTVAPSDVKKAARAPSVCTFLLCTYLHRLVLIVDRRGCFLSCMVSACAETTLLTPIYHH